MSHEEFLQRRFKKFYNEASVQVEKNRLQEKTGEDDLKECTYVVLYVSHSRKWSNFLSHVLSLPTLYSWQYIVLTTSIINFILVSLYIVIPTTLGISRRIVMLFFIIVDIIYLGDVILLFLHRFWKKLKQFRRVIETPIALLVCDVLSLLCIIYGFINMFSPPKLLNKSIYIYIRSVTILRLRRLAAFQVALNELQESRIKILVSVLCIMVLVTQHTLTLIWYVLSDHGSKKGNFQNSSWLNVYMEDKEQPSYEDFLPFYILCSYSVIQFMVRVGLGDVVPVLKSEIAFVCICMVLGFILFKCLLVSLLMLICSNRENLKDTFFSQVEGIKVCFKNIRTGSSTYKQVKKYYNTLWEQKRGIKKAEVFDTLPLPLRMELMYDVNYVPLNRSMLFHGLDESHLRALSLLMKQEFLLPGDIVYHLGVVKTSMIVVLRGVLELLSPEDDESPIISFQNGTVLGEASLFLSLPSECTVRASIYTEIAVVERVAFIKFMKNYPTALSYLKNIINDRIWVLTRKTITQERQRNVFIKCLKERANLLEYKTDTGTVEKSTVYNTFLPLYRISYLNSNTHVPKICLTETCPYIVEGNSSFVTISEICVFWIHLGFILTYPYYAVFERELHFIVTVTRLASDIISVFDIVILTFTTIIDRQNMIYTFNQILLYQMKRPRFLIYFLPIFPYEYFAQSDNEDNRKPVLLLSFKLFRILRCVEIMEKFQVKYFDNNVFILILKGIAYYMLIIYLGACILFLTTCYDSNCSTTSWFYRLLVGDFSKNITGKTIHQDSFLASLHYSSSTLLGYGFGVITPYPGNDIIYVTLLIYVGMIFRTAFFTIIATKISALNIQRDSYFQKFESLQMFLTRRKISAKVCNSVKSFLELQFEYDHGIGRRIFYSTAPLHLQRQVLDHDLTELLESVPLFHMVNVDFLAQLELYCPLVILPPDSIMYYKGDIMREMFIIKSGLCRVTSSSNSYIMGPGHFVGDMEMLIGLSKRHTVRTITACKICCIRYSSYRACLSSFPNEYKNINTIEHDPEIQKEVADYVKDDESILIVGGRTSLYEPETRKAKFDDFIKRSFCFVLPEYKYNRKKYMKQFNSWGKFKACGFLLVPICIRPDGPFLKLWMTIRFILLMLYNIVAAFALITPPAGADLFPFLFFIELLGYLNIYFMLHVGYFNKAGLLISHPKMTSKYYFTHSFTLDLVGSLPFYLLAFSNEDDNSHINHFQPNWQHSNWRQLILLQTIRYVVLFRDNLMVKSHLLAGIMAVVSFTTVIMTILETQFIKTVCGYHFSTVRDPTKLRSELSRQVDGIHYYGYLKCVNGSFYHPRENQEDLHTITLRGMYWILDMWFFIGNGEMYITDEYFITSILAFFLGIVTEIYLIALIQSYVYQETTHNVEFETKLEEFLLFLENNNVSEELINSACSYFQYQWKRTHGLHASILLLHLNTALAEDVGFCLYEEVLRKVPLFEDVDASFIRMISRHLEEGYYLKDEKLISVYDVHSTIYIILCGQVNIYGIKHELITTLGIGGIFGNIQKVVAGLSTVSVTANRDLDVLIISSQQFFNICKDYPKIERKLFALLKNVGDFLIPTSPEDIDILVETFMFYAEERENRLGHIHSVGGISGGSMGSNNQKKGMKRSQSISIKSARSSIRGGQKESRQSKLSIATKNMGSELFWLLWFLNPIKWFTFSLLPDHPVFFYFHLATMLATYYQLFFIGFLTVYQQENYGFLFGISCIPEPIFYLRTFMSLHTAYHHSQNIYVFRNRLIAKEYFKNYKGLFWDIVPNIPFFIFGFFVRHTWIYVSILRCWQLLRGKYFIDYFRMADAEMGQFVKSELIRVSMLSTIVCHYLALMFYGYIHFNNFKLRNKLKNDNLLPFMHSLYYTLSIATRTGIGDIRPYSNMEIVITIFSILVTQLLFFYAMYKLLSIIQVKMYPLFVYELKVMQLKIHMENLRLSTHQMNKFWRYLKKLWSDEAGIHTPVLFNRIPYSLGCSIMHDLYADILSNSYLLKGISQPLLKQICFYIKRTVFFTGNYIVQAGDTTACLFWIQKGEVSVLTVHSNLTETRYEILDHTDTFGLVQGLFYGVPWHFSFRAESRCYILTLPLESWNHVLDYFPQDKALIYQRLQDKYLIV